MKRTSVFLVIGLMAAYAPCFALQGVAGGILLGFQQYDPDLANQDMGCVMIGGFGYGVSSEGVRLGGFGMAALGGEGESGPSDLNCGIGGFITGWEFRTGPFVIAVNLWTGLGGAAYEASDPGGFMIAFGELSAELGLVLTRWMRLVGYMGLQAMGNLAPGRPFDELDLYTPVTGIRLSWGSL